MVFPAWDLANSAIRSQRKVHSSGFGVHPDRVPTSPRKNGWHLSISRKHNSTVFPFLASSSVMPHCRSTKENSLSWTWQHRKIVPKTSAFSACQKQNTIPRATRTREQRLRIQWIRHRLSSIDATPSA